MDVLTITLSDLVPGRPSACRFSHPFLSRSNCTLLCLLVRRKDCLHHFESRLRRCLVEIISHHDRCQSRKMTTTTLLHCRKVFLEKVPPHFSPLLVIFNSVHVVSEDILKRGNLYPCRFQREKLLKFFFCLFFLLSLLHSCYPLHTFVLQNCPQNLSRFSSIAFLPVIPGAPSIFSRITAVNFIFHLM